MVLACLNIMLLNDYFGLNIYSSNATSSQYCSKQPITKAKQLDISKKKLYARDSMEMKELKVY